MKRVIKTILWALVLVFIGMHALEYVSNHNIQVMNPKGLIAAKQKWLILVSAGLMCLVVIPVFIMIPLFYWKYREQNKKSKYAPEWGHSTLAEIIWWGIPCLMIAVLGILTWTSTHALNPYQPIVNGKKPLNIQVVALDWKWLFIYPEQGIATVNYVQFPKDTPITFSISADAPMNSFWIPQLAGQIYAMPGMTTKMNLIANEAGNYKGLSANISGKGFAGMFFRAVATSDEEFEEWVSKVRSSPLYLSNSEYEQLARPSEYNKVTYYSGVSDGLFNQIVMKYMHKGQQ
ncbi:MAG TPA: ubiquinol oxidase subunit II [Chlamydiales bacterium]|nr:ubiquinol oxidase subunit II [Chlamydiales bacterium]